MLIATVAFLLSCIGPSVYGLVSSSDQSYKSNKKKNNYLAVASGSDSCSILFR